MKLLTNGILISVASVLSIAPSSTRIKAKSPFTLNGSDIISHFVNDQNYTYYLIAGRGNGELTITTRLYNNNTDGLVYTNTQTETLSKFNETMFSIYLQIKNRVKASGLKVEFEYQCGSYNATTSGVIYPTVSDDVSITNHKDSPIVFDGVLFRVEDNEIKTSEQFDFTDTIDYISVKNSNKINFSEIKFLYSDDLEFKAEKVEYHIKDYKNIYPSFKKIGNEVIIGLNYTVNGNEVSFYVDDKLYVNENSLEMSPTNLPEYRRTSDFYIPLGKEELFIEDESYILIRKAGYSENNIYIPLTFFYNNKYLGECYQSDYCISGGIRE